MITKPSKRRTTGSDRRARAGAEAEGQTAYYLRHRFQEDRDVHVLHDLRLEDPSQPKETGAPGACQMDHLVVHRWGIFIIETKSVKAEVRVRPDGSGGGEWTRMWNNKEQGMPSPIEQAKRQAEFLRRYLQRRTNTLFESLQRGLPALSRLLPGPDQQDLASIPIQILIAVSDKGRIRRFDGWTEPTTPLADFVTKADMVPEKITQEIQRHEQGPSLPNPQPTECYGLWSMSDEDALLLANFLAGQHAEPTWAREGETPDVETAPETRADPTRTEPACRFCDSQDLTAQWGKYGYYWRCKACGKNTPMPTTCSSCGAQGKPSKVVRIRKAKAQFFRDCKGCGASELVWTEPD